MIRGSITRWTPCHYLDRSHTAVTFIFCDKSIIAVFQLRLGEIILPEKPLKKIFGAFCCSDIYICLFRTPLWYMVKQCQIRLQIFLWISNIWHDNDLCVPDTSSVTVLTHFFNLIKVKFHQTETAVLIYFLTYSSYIRQTTLCKLSFANRHPLWYNLAKTFFSD